MDCSRMEVSIQGMHHKEVVVCFGMVFVFQALFKGNTEGGERQAEVDVVRSQADSVGGNFINRITAKTHGVGMCKAIVQDTVVSV